jgi:hypothetical protein
LAVSVDFQNQGDTAAYPLTCETQAQVRSKS